jgi:3-oxoadipate enol-lactonase
MVQSSKTAVLSNGAAICYTEYGEGAPLFCLTGINSTQGMWSPSFITMLAQHFRVITFDHRGVGGSVGPRPHSIAAFAEDASLLIKHLDLPKAHILGVSMGGMVAQQMAVRHPDCVDHLVLGATSCAGLLIRPKLRMLLGAFFYLKPELAARALVSDHFLQADPKHLPNLLDTMRSSSAGSTVFLEQLATIANFNLRRDLSKITAPTLVICGTDDQIINHENSELIASEISGAQLIKWAGVGHLFPRERPEDTVRAVTNFVRS